MSALEATAEVAVRPQKDADDPCETWVGPFHYKGSFSEHLTNHICARPGIRFDFIVAEVPLRCFGPDTFACRDAPDDAKNAPFHPYRFGIRVRD